MKEHHKVCPMCVGTGYVRSPLGEIIKSIREERGITQAELADMLAMMRSVGASDVVPS